jgi:hypothetical protein
MESITDILFGEPITKHYVHASLHHAEHPALNIIPLLGVYATSLYMSMIVSMHYRWQPLVVWISLQLAFFPQGVLHYPFQDHTQLTHCSGGSLDVVLACGGIFGCVPIDFVI